MIKSFEASFDIVAVLIASVWLVIPFALIWIIVLCTSEGSAIYWSKRVGRKGDIFLMPKFRSMRIDTPEVATDKLDDAIHYITPFGFFCVVLALMSYRKFTRFAR